MSDTGIGAALRRKEDGRFITGRGRYVDDMVRPGQTYAFIVRSPEAHAEITSLDTAMAEGADGVLAVITGADLEEAGVGGLPCGWQIHSRDGTPMVEPGHPALAVGRVRHVGDPVAMVVAESYGQARAAGALVDVQYSPLPVVASIDQATRDGAPLVWDDAAGNLCFDWEIGDHAATEAAFDSAAHTVSIDIVNNRLVPNAIEPRAAIGEYDPMADTHTLYTTSQNPHVIRLLMGAFVLGIPEHKLRVVAPDVGGGFGSKIFHYAEEVLVTWASRHVGRPVKWTAERTESFMSDAHGRDHVTRADLALDAEGRFLGLRVHTHANLGAYLSTFGPAVPTYLHATLFAGCYTTPAIYGNVRAVFTNTVPVDAYRGAGRPEAAFMLERLVDKAARTLGMDPVEIRRKNFIQPDQFPYQTPVALEYDIGDYGATLDAALELADWDGFAARKSESAARGKLRGIGLSTFVEACGIAPSAVAGALGARAGLFEVGHVRVHPTGSVTVYTGTHSHGQGHETTFAQLVSDRFGVPADQVEVVHGDTGQVPFGMGTYGSRSLAVGGSAIYMAMEKIIDKGRIIAAHLMEASADDVVFEDGGFTVAGTDKTLGLGDVALAAYVPHNYPEGLEPGLDETAFYDPKNFTFPAGAHVVEVEIDPDTGVVELMGVACADDVGTVINPMIVDGQMHGGLAPGHRSGPSGALPVRRPRPARDRVVHELHHAAGGGSPVLPDGTSHHGVHAQSDRRQGGGRGGIDRGAGGRDQRRRRRALGVRRRAHRHARDARESLADHPEREGGLIMEDFTFRRAESVADAQTALREAADGKFLAGGQSLLPLLKLEMAAPDAVVSIAGLPELGGIERDGDELVVGAGMTHADVAESDVVRTAIPALAALAGRIGDPQVRNRGTLGGSIAHADPSADYPAALVGLDATVVTDRRRIAAEDFFVGVFETPLEDDEVILSVRFPVPTRAAYAKFPNPASKYAIVGVMVAETGGGVRVAVTGAAPVVFRAMAMEEALAADFSTAAVTDVAVAPDGMISDIDAQADFRAHLVGVMTRRAVEACT